MGGRVQGATANPNAGGDDLGEDAVDLESRAGPSCLCMLGGRWSLRNQSWKQALLRASWPAPIKEITKGLPRVVTLATLLDLKFEWGISLAALCLVICMLMALSRISGRRRSMISFTHAGTPIQVDRLGLQSLAGKTGASRNVPVLLRLGLNVLWETLYPKLWHPCPGYSHLTCWEAFLTNSERRQHR